MISSDLGRSAQLIDDSRALILERVILIAHRAHTHAVTRRYRATHTCDDMMGCGPKNRSRVKTEPPRQHLAYDDST